MDGFTGPHRKSWRIVRKQPVARMLHAGKQAPTRHPRALTDKWRRLRREREEAIQEAIRTTRPQFRWKLVTLVYEGESLQAWKAEDIRQDREEDADREGEDLD